MDTGSITAALELIKKGVEVSRRLKKIEITDALLAAREAINDQREKNLSLVDENGKLKEENKQLNESLRQKDELVYSDSVYWFKSDSERTRPLCPKCWEKDRLVISINTTFMPPDCPNCKNGFDV